MTQGHLVGGIQGIGRREPRARLLPGLAVGSPLLLLAPIAVTVLVLASASFDILDRGRMGLLGMWPNSVLLLSLPLVLLCATMRTGRADALVVQAWVSLLAGSAATLLLGVRGASPLFAQIVPEPGGGVARRVWAELSAAYLAGQPSYDERLLVFLLSLAVATSAALGVWGWMRLACLQRRGTGRLAALAASSVLVPLAGVVAVSLLQPARASSQDMALAAGASFSSALAAACGSVLQDVQPRIRAAGSFEEAVRVAQSTVAARRASGCPH